MAFPFTRHGDEGLEQAANRETPRTELVQLASHRSPEVRAAIAARRDCPMATMFALAYDESTLVLEALALNASAPRGVLEVLATHRRETVRGLAGRRLRYMDAAA